MQEKSTISAEEKKLLKQMYWRSFTLHAAVTPSKQGASGVSYAMQPFIDLFYKNDKDKLQEAMVRQMSYFNTNVAVYPFILGVTASMEKENSEKSDFNSESINAIKTSLMGPSISGYWRLSFLGRFENNCSGDSSEFGSSRQCFSTNYFLITI